LGHDEMHGAIHIVGGVEDREPCTEERPLDYLYAVRSRVRVHHLQHDRVEADGDIEAVELDDIDDLHGDIDCCARGDLRRRRCDAHDHRVRTLRLTAPGDQCEG
jgi:hypothetical protein